MFKFITKRTTKAQRSNLIALFVSLAILGTIAVKHQQNCWATDTNGFQVGAHGKVANVFSRFSRSCNAAQLQLLTPPTELNPMLYNTPGYVQPRYSTRYGASTR